MKFLSNPRIIAVSSGRGRVGKTNCVANLAIYFAGIDNKCLSWMLILDCVISMCFLELGINITSSMFIKEVGYEHSTCSADELRAAPPSFLRLS